MDGRFLGLRLDFLCDLGAYQTPTGAFVHFHNPSQCLVGPYAVPVAAATFRMVHTTATPVAAYRGAGRPDVTLALERLVDAAAFRLGMDPFEIRRRNLLQPDDFPYATPNGGGTYDSGDYPALLNRAATLSDASGFAARRAAAERAGRLLGRGVSLFVESTGPGSAPKDQAELRLHCDEAGEITAEIRTVTQSSGQGHETTFPALVAAELGISAESVRLVASDPHETLVGNHTGASRSIVGTGSAVLLAARAVLARAAAAANRRWRVNDVQAQGCRIASRAADLDVPFGTFAAELLADEPGSLDAIGDGRFGPTYPSGCHVAEVEVDRETGTTRIARYVAVDDCGTVLDHVLVEGQVHGGLAQGAGQVFTEGVVHDRDTGQMLTATLMDYGLPRADLVPEPILADGGVASPANPLGAKGAGESGVTGSVAALSSAVLDAVRSSGVADLAMPFTAARVWEALHDMAAAPRRRAAE
jgi:carbon-monoxide dehydrogenase large subunit